MCCFLFSLFIFLVPMYQHWNVNIKMNFVISQQGLFLSEVNNRETKAAIETNKGLYCLRKRIEKFPLSSDILIFFSWNKVDSRQDYQLCLTKSVLRTSWFAENYSTLKVSFDLLFQYFFLLKLFWNFYLLLYCNARTMLYCPGVKAFYSIPTWNITS